MKIWKYGIDRLSPGEQVLRVPEVTVPVAVGQDPTGHPCIWYKVDDTSEIKPRKITVAWTGERCPARADYIGFVIFDALVLHIFDGEE